MRRKNGWRGCCRCLLCFHPGQTGPPPRLPERGISRGALCTLFHLHHRLLLCFWSLPSDLWCSPSCGTQRGAAGVFSVTSQPAPLGITLNCLHPFSLEPTGLSAGVWRLDHHNHAVRPWEASRASRRGCPVPGVRLAAVCAALPVGGSGVL